MFGPVQPTQYDLAFSLFGFPVRVTPWFWLIGVMMGFDLLQLEQGPLLLLIWLAVTFVSILFHELGHAAVANLFGYSPSIMLHQFGGVAMLEPTRGYSTARAILITAAGPAFGFALGVAVWLVNLALGPENLSELGEFTVRQMIWVNIGWTIVNCLPVMPLDGGQICREVCMAASPYRGIFVALWISIVVAALIGAGFLYVRFTYPGLFFLLLAMQNYQELQAAAGVLMLIHDNPKPKISPPNEETDDCKMQIEHCKLLFADG